MIPSNYSLQKPPKNGNFSQNAKAVACRLWLCNSEIRNPNSEIGRASCQLTTIYRYCYDFWFRVQQI
jgi:hypothetical protein